MFRVWFLFFFFNDTATTEIYTLSLHDALPIYDRGEERQREDERDDDEAGDGESIPEEPAPEQLLGAPADDGGFGRRDRKSTRLNSSHANISYAAFCLKKRIRRSIEHTYELQSC